MSGKIRGRPPQSPVAGEAEAPRAAAPKQRPVAGATQGGNDGGSDDMFERRAALRAAVENRVQTVAQRPPVGRFVFSEKDLEYLANTFASTLREHPQAGRKERAQLLAAVILRRKRRGALLGGLTDPELDTMSREIADVLGESPVFGQLVDTITEATSG